MAYHPKNELHMNPGELAQTMSAYWTGLQKLSMDHMVVSLNKWPNVNPRYSSLFRDPQKGTPSSLIPDGTLKG